MAPGARAAGGARQREQAQVPRPLPVPRVDVRQRLGARLVVEQEHMVVGPRDGRGQRTVPCGQPPVLALEVGVGRQPLDPPRDGERMRVSLARPRARGEAEHGVEDPQRMEHLLAHALDQRGDVELRAEHLDEVRLHRGRVPAELAPGHEVVAHPVFPAVGIRDAQRPLEAVRPQQPRVAQHPAAATAKRLVQVALLGAEPAQPRVQPRPGAPAASEQPEAVHRDLKRLAAGVVEARVARPLPVHARAPRRLEVGDRPARRQVVVEHRPLDEVEAAGMRSEPVQQRFERPRREQHVGVHAADDVRVGFAEDEVAHRGAGVAAKGT